MSAIAGRALAPIFLHSRRHGGIYLEKVEQFHVARWGMVSRQHFPCDSNF